MLNSPHRQKDRQRVLFTYRQKKESNNTFVMFWKSLSSAAVQTLASVGDEAAR